MSSGRLFCPTVICSRRRTSFILITCFAFLVSQKLAPIPEEQPLPPQILISSAQEASPPRGRPNSQSQSSSDRLNPRDIAGSPGSSSASLKSQNKKLMQTLRQKDSEIRALVESLAQRDEEILDKDHEIDDLSSKLAQKDVELRLLDGLLDTVHESCEEGVVEQNKLLRREIVLVREENRLLRSLGELEDEDEEEDEEDDTTDIEDDDDVGIDDDQDAIRGSCQSKTKVFALTDADLDIVEGRAAKRQVIYLQETIQDLEKRLKHANLLSLATTYPNNDTGSTSSECDTDAETDIVRHPSGPRGHLPSRHVPQGTRKTFSHSETQKLKRSGTTAHIPTSFLPLPILLSPPSVAPPKFSSSTTESCNRRINGSDDADSLFPPSTPSYTSLEALGLAKPRGRGYVGRFWDWIADGSCCSDCSGD